MVKVVREHYNGFDFFKDFDFKGDLSFEKDYSYPFNKSRAVIKPLCFHIRSNKEENKHQLANSYFIGVDWIEKNKCALYVEPKLNEISEAQTDFIYMLFSILKHPELYHYLDELYEIRWDEDQISIDSLNDHLTPLLIVQFLQVVQRIVRKGLKKSYYKVESNLFGKVKGKVMIASSIKHNLLKNKPLNTFCAYDEFGFNGLENRLLKKALMFVQRYLNSHKDLKTGAGLHTLFNYINPAFASISDEVSLHDVKHSKTNAFYKEYTEATRLAKLILKKFGYNISNTEQRNSIKTPPFWIDMSKLFELYVLGLLKDNYGSRILYGKDAKGNYGLPDYLYTEPSKEMVIDAKYKTIYQKDDYDPDNIRQVSGYARDNEILKTLGIKNNEIVPCLIIYPNSNEFKNAQNFKMNINSKEVISDFREFYRLGVPLPVITI